jgi:hypothetical protein
MAVKLMVNDDGTSASSSPSWMVGVVDSIVGDLKMAFVRKVRLGDEHDVYVVQRKTCFQFFYMVVYAIGVPECTLKKCSHYLNFVWIVVRRFIMVPICLKRLFITALRSEILLDCCWGWVTGGEGAGVGVRGRVFEVI